MSIMDKDLNITPATKYPKVVIPAPVLRSSFATEGGKAGIQAGTGFRIKSGLPPDRQRLPIRSRGEDLVSPRKHVTSREVS